MKERLTGAILLVALIVLLVPELLTGPIRSAPRAAAVASAAEEPPLRSYTIKLGDEPHARDSAAHSGPDAAGRTFAVIGVLADKDAAAIGTALAPVIDHWILCTLEGARGMSATQLAARLAPPAAPVELADSVPAGCERARGLARRGDRVVVCGSVYTVGPALRWLRIY